MKARTYTGPAVTYRSLFCGGEVLIAFPDGEGPPDDSEAKRRYGNDARRWTISATLTPAKPGRRRPAKARRT